MRGVTRPWQSESLGKWRHAAAWTSSIEAAARTASRLAVYYPHEPHHAPARPALQLLTYHRVPGHPTSAAAACAGADAEEEPQQGRLVLPRRAVVGLHLVLVQCRQVQLRVGGEHEDRADAERRPVMDRGRHFDPSL
jgi:hypothetical protein